MYDVIMNSKVREMDNLVNNEKTESLETTLSLSLYIYIHTLCIHEKTKESIGVNIAGTNYRRHC